MSSNMDTYIARRSIRLIGQLEKIQGSGDLTLDRRLLVKSNIQHSHRVEKLASPIPNKQ